MTLFNSKCSGGKISSPIGSPGGTVLNEAIETKIQRLNGRKNINIGTWNVQSLFEAGKLANLNQEIRRLDIDILGVSKTWWPDNGMCIVTGGRFYYSGNQNKNHRNGVGIFITDKLSTSIIDFFPYSDRLALLKISARPVNLNVIQAYAPTSESTDQDIETFYDGLRELLKLTKKT